MNEQGKGTLKIVGGVLQAVITAVIVIMLGIMVNTVILQGNLIAQHSTQFATTADRLLVLEQKGSRSMEVYAAKAEDIAKRVERLEAAVLVLQTAPGELKAINVRLDMLQESQKRIEQGLKEHMKNGKP